MQKHNPHTIGTKDLERTKRNGRAQMSDSKSKKHRVQACKSGTPAAHTLVPAQGFRLLVIRRIRVQVSLRLILHFIQNSFYLSQFRQFAAAIPCVDEKYHW
jgi:hypothetical protein